MNELNRDVSGVQTQPHSEGLVAHPEISEEIDLRELFRKLWRRKSLIIGTAVFFTILAIGVLFQLTPRYSTKALILIGSSQNKVVNLEAVLSGLSGDAETIQSEIEVLKSRQLIEKLVKKLKLNRFSEFNDALRPKGFVSQILSEYLDIKQYIPIEWLDAIKGTKKSIQFSQSELEAQKLVQLVDTLLESKLAISQKGRSRVIVVKTTSENPRLAAKIANTLSELYIFEQLEAKFEATRRATGWLEGRVSKLRAKVKETERAVEYYRKKSGLISGQLGNITAQQTSELNTQLILARTARVEANARLRQVQIMVSSRGGVESAAEVLESVLIGRLREQEAEVQRRAAEFAEEYGSRHPKIISVKAEARNLKRKIGVEVNKIIRGLENEVEIAKARETSLQKSFDGLKLKVSSSNRAEIRLRSLQREADANRVLLKIFLTRFKETSAQEDIGIQDADARIISKAAISILPSFPKKKLIVAMVFVGATFLGILLAFTIEQLDRGFRSGEQIESATGISVLGMVPTLSGLTKIGKTPANYIIEKPTSAFGEAIRSLHTSLRLSNLDDPPKSILITSCLPAEGKTSISICLARMLASAGHKVIALDVDLRRPSFSDIFKDDGPGLVEYLTTSDLDLKDLIHIDHESGAHVLLAGATSRNPPDILGSQKMTRLLRSLEKQYEYVVLDSPPVLAVSDARILSGQVHATLFVVRWADTPREIVVQGLKQILTSGGNLAGIVLSQVNAKKHARYGYGDSGYYYGRIKKYYVG